MLTRPDALLISTAWLGHLANVAQALPGNDGGDQQSPTSEPCPARATVTCSHSGHIGLGTANALLAAGTANLAIADGSALVFVGVSGGAAWLVWLLATDVRLVRAKNSRPS